MNIYSNCRKQQAQALKFAAESQIGILENIAGYEPEDIEGDDVELRFETEGGFDTGSNVSIVDQCQSAADIIRFLLMELESSRKLTVKLPSEHNNVGFVTDGIRNKAIAECRLALVLACVDAGFTLEFAGE